MKKIIVIIQIVVLSSLLIRCGNEPQRVYMEGHDNMRFTVEEITATPGQNIELTLKTVSKMPKSSMAHNFVLLKKGVDAEEFDMKGQKYKENGYIDPSLVDNIIVSTDMLGDGEMDMVTFKAPTEKGKYTYICTFPGHYSAGMKGTLIVE